MSRDRRRRQGRQGWAWPAPAAAPALPFRAGYTCGMCGRFSLFTPTPVLAEAFDLASFPELAPRYNIAPTQPVAAVRAGAAGRQLVRLRWGLVAPWAKDTKQAPINARAETAADKPTFRHALRKRRCLLPPVGRAAVGLRRAVGALAGAGRPRRELRHPDHRGQRAGAAGA